MKRYILIFFTISLFLSCIEKTKKPSNIDMTEAKNLSTLKKTEFVPTLENKISDDKNAIYCVSLLYAWNEVKEQLNSNITIPKNFNDLLLLNNSKSHINVLDKDEYTVNSEIIDDRINVRAEFNKSLPFKVKLQEFVGALTINYEKFKSFGLYGTNYERIELLEIIYYKDDDNFIIKLKPFDKEDQIIIMKSDNKFQTMLEMSSEIERLSIIGNLEKNGKKSAWKYKINPSDLVVIPNFDFNIQTNYSSLEDTKFVSQSRTLFISKAFQRTAFTLNENGAEIESEAEIEVVEETNGEEKEEVQHPKKMILNKPFFLELKKSKSEIPYFGLWITNTELLIKE